MNDELLIVIPPTDSREDLPIWSAAPGPKTTVEQLYRACEAFELEVEFFYGRLFLVSWQPDPDHPDAIPCLEPFLNTLYGPNHAIDVTVRDSFYPGTTDAEVQADD